MKKTLCICYHGTDKKNADAILKTGFKKWTYFARHLEDAIKFGGNYVFGVSFESSRIPDDWQFMISESFSRKTIVDCYHYQKGKIFENNKLKKKIFESNV